MGHYRPETRLLRKLEFENVITINEKAKDITRYLSVQLPIEILDQKFKEIDSNTLGEGSEIELTVEELNLSTSYKEFDVFNTPAIFKPGNRQSEPFKVDARSLKSDDRVIKALPINPLSVVTALGDIIKEDGFHADIVICCVKKDVTKKQIIEAKKEGIPVVFADAFVIDGNTTLNYLIDTNFEALKGDFRTNVTLLILEDASEIVPWVKARNKARRNLEQNLIDVYQGGIANLIVICKQEARRVIKMDRGITISPNSTDEAKELFEIVHTKLMAMVEAGVIDSKLDPTREGIRVDLDGILAYEGSISPQLQDNIKKVESLHRETKKRKQEYADSINLIRDNISKADPQIAEEITRKVLDSKKDITKLKELGRLSELAPDIAIEVIGSKNPVKETKKALEELDKENVDKQLKEHGEVIHPRLQPHEIIKETAYKQHNFATADIRKHPNLFYKLDAVNKAYWVGGDFHLEGIVPKHKKAERCWLPSFDREDYAEEAYKHMLISHYCSNKKLLRKLPDLKGKVIFTDGCLLAADILAALANGVIPILDVVATAPKISNLFDSRGREGGFTTIKHICLEDNFFRGIDMFDYEDAERVEVPAATKSVEPVAALPPETPEGWDDAKAEEDEFYEVYNVPTEDEVTDEEYLEYSDTIENGTRKREFFKRTYLKEADVSRHWKELCKKHHPDLGGKDSDMAQINAEYRVLIAKARIREKII